MSAVDARAAHAGLKRVEAHKHRFDLDDVNSLLGFAKQHLGSVHSVNKLEGE